MVFSSWIGFLPNTPFQALEACIVSMTTDYHAVLWACPLPRRQRQWAGKGLRSEPLQRWFQGTKPALLQCF